MTIERGVGCPKQDCERISFYDIKRALKFETLFSNTLRL
jgi:hypothetical protein